MTPAEVVAASRVPGTNSVFFLGCFESRVTLFAQQVRALNLVDAILDQGLVRETGKVAIVGGGAAGLTAATALARAAPVLKTIDVYEQKGELLHFQQNSQRYLHPYLYDWPATGPMRLDAGLPILNWCAGPAGDVAKTIVGQFDAQARTSPIRVKVGAIVSRVEPFPRAGCRVFVKDSKDGDIYDVVILSIGFGYEAHVAEQTHSYWAPSILAGPIRAAGAGHLLFISGNGDGGLVDFVMAAFNGLQQREICDFITGYDGLDEVRRVLMDRGRRRW